MLHTISNMPMNWENAGLLDEALRSVPLQRIYAEAEENSQIYQAEAESLGPMRKPVWGYQDCVVMAMLQWFKGSFFSWVNNPPCSKCGHPTIGVGMAAPIDEEKVRGANTVELYRCSDAQCSSYERFPRYNDAFVLMQTRKGRVGEWSICFGMLCRAMGLRTRWVWNSEDHVWIEYYSIHRRRWVHIDPCEGWFDKPTNYTEGEFPSTLVSFRAQKLTRTPGWKRRIGYCIAFSRDGATDVTRRYVRNFSKWGGERTRCSEPALLYILEEIKALRRKDMEKNERLRSKAEDIREDQEMSQHVALSLALELCKSLPGWMGPETRQEVDMSKAAEARQEGEMPPSWLQ
jgi:peptide-N4-(N-acetyl-beta-glucosaminyl)asparagine amidase